MTTASRPSPIPWLAAVLATAACGVACAPTIAPSSGASADAGKRPAAFDDAQGIMSEDAGPADAGLQCGPASVAAFEAPAYVPARAYQNVCSMGDIAAFFEACAALGSDTCGAWTAANVATDGGAGTACGNCIAAPGNGGAIWFDPIGNAWPNLAGCMQVLDPTHGLACAKAYQAANACRTTACDHLCLAPHPDCPDTCAQCYDAVDGVGDAGADAGCATYEAAERSACAVDFADGGALSTCAAQGEAAALTTVITLLCGPAPSGG